MSAPNCGLAAPSLGPSLLLCMQEEGGMSDFAYGKGGASTKIVIYTTLY